ncbi:hypothetical protein [Bdellovibrio sp. ArHS]|uniref:beta strand repeat-containing protein n=1 Tax=Bdellovibrio sp. ArHS TaxID=1569284 RepID=UPI000AFD4C96
MRTGTYLFILISLFGTLATAAPNALTYQGRIVKSDGHPLEYGSTSFIFEITNPNGSCVIYREQRDGVNLLNSNGVFDVPIGSGTKLFPSDPLFTLLDAFNNSKIHNCYGGATYTAASMDIRLLKVQFHDGTGWKVISPANEIRSVPYSAYALSAEKLGTRSADEFLLKAGLPTCSANEFLTWTGAALTCAPVSGAAGGTVTQVTSTNAYLSIANTTSTPALTLNIGAVAGTVAAGDDARFSDARTPTGAAAGDLSGTYPNPVVAKIQNTAVSALAPTAGQVLKYDGTKWAPAADNNAGGTVTNIVTGTGLSGGPISTTGTISLANTTVTAGSYTRATITVDAQGRLTSASSGAAVSLSTEVTGVLPVANGGTGQATALAAFNALSPLTTKGDVLVNDGTNDIRLPSGTNGQVLSVNTTQASGLQWVTPTNGTVTNVTGTAPIVVSSGGTTPVITIDDASATSKGAMQVGNGLAVNAGVVSADPTTFPSAVPVSKGGTGATSILANRLVATNGTGSALTAFNCGHGQILTFDATGMMTCSSFTTSSVFLNNGNSFGVSAVLGTNDNQSLSFKTNNSVAMTILPDGKTGLGTAAPATSLEVLETSGATSRGITSTTIANSNPGGLMQTRGARGTASAPTATQTNDTFGWMAFLGHDGVGFSTQAQPTGVSAIATENWSTVGHGSALRFTTTTNTEVNGGERMRIDHNGNVGIGTTTPSAKLEVAGNAKITGNLVGAVKDTSGTALRMCSGTSANSGWTYYSLHSAVTGSCGAYMNIDTSACGFSTVFRYFPSIQGDGGHWVTTGATSVYTPTATSFRIYINLMGSFDATNCNTTTLPHNTNKYRIDWLAVGL